MKSLVYILAVWCSAFLSFVALRVAWDAWHAYRHENRRRGWWR